ncbi:hypothetical protein AN191_02175 [Loktanella sp. 5RATIMAR09]|uniref:DUF6522 family protein n=1 Tax=Loktanella sp. 5RATIMAR09 TaxID=1225655 RepID=UPI0006EB5CF0|nr:DUF6522 family protein [Loktanella sp. 5RATIMAR09]KQI73699.1 hypothetical protein AN191_02175 [Loktanella sp. 5RATIMAR09]
MKIELINNQPVIDAQDLGALLDLEPAQVQAKMRAGEITSKYEVGQDEDSGRFRMTFFYNGKHARLTCAEDGTVVSTIRTHTGAS